MSRVIILGEWYASQAGPRLELVQPLKLPSLSLAPISCPLFRLGRTPLSVVLPSGSAWKNYTNDNDN